ncbi:MAG: MBL fold metallo-hydrolase [Planctomycetota bacterium]|jgi:7,8-dihydropterin-6-yl-methyl-4-(beta-D-ribofuranosyl)aminobenzene 5'-phosphate synthase
MRQRPIIALLPLAATAISVSVVCSEGTAHEKGRIMKEQAHSIPDVDVNELTLTVVYDNNAYKQGLQTAWGFSCVIAGTEKTVLFDTGRDGSVIDNMEKLAIEPNRTEVIVLSHIHPDHTGGLESFLNRNPAVAVYLPKAFPEKFKDNVLRHGAKMVQVEQPVEICENVYSTGQVGGWWIKEQALAVRTNKGLIVVTGCAHPGIIRIVKSAKEYLKDDVLLVMGGFHLERASKGKVEKVISALRELGVRHVAPCHCTGDKARSLFEKDFGKNYIDIGAGKVIMKGDLR